MFIATKKHFSELALSGRKVLLLQIGVSLPVCPALITIKNKINLLHMLIQQTIGYLSFSLINNKSKLFNLKKFT